MHITNAPTPKTIYWLGSFVNTYKLNSIPMIAGIVMSIWLIHIMTNGIAKIITQAICPIASWYVITELQMSIPKSGPTVVVLYPPHRSVILDNLPVGNAAIVVVVLGRYGSVPAITDTIFTSDTTAVIRIRFSVFMINAPSIIRITRRT